MQQQAFGRISYGGPYRLLSVAVLSVLISLCAFVAADSRLVVLLACGACFLMFAAVYRLDYLHPAVAFALPWITILSFSTIPISEHARDLDTATSIFLFVAIFIWLVGTSGAPVQVSTLREPTKARVELRPRFELALAFAFFLAAIAASVNVAVSGFIPLVSLIGTGDSRYLDFGIPSVYGAFLAYSNALACVCYFIYLRTARRTFLVLFLTIVVTHILFMSRQNIVTLLVEAFVIRCLTVGRVSRATIVILVVAGLVGFSLLGELRSGDIREIIRVSEGFMWLPVSFIWLYAYSYFSVVNLENMMLESGAPFFDGFMWQRLLPSILRGDSDHGSFIEISSMNVSTYIYPIYMDVGYAGVLCWTMGLAVLTGAVYSKALQQGRFVHIATYSCLFFCALMSFFIDFWFYLPVIVQVLFFWLFDRMCFRRSAGISEINRQGQDAACQM